MERKSRNTKLQNALFPDKIKENNIIFKKPCCSLRMLLRIILSDFGKPLVEIECAIRELFPYFKSASGKTTCNTKALKDCVFSNPDILQVPGNTYKKGETKTFFTLRKDISFCYKLEDIIGPNNSLKEFTVASEEHFLKLLHRDAKIRSHYSNNLLSHKIRPSLVHKSQEYRSKLNPIDRPTSHLKHIVNKVNEKSDSSRENKLKVIDGVSDYTGLVKNSQKIRSIYTPKDKVPHERSFSKENKNNRSTTNKNFVQHYPGQGQETLGSKPHKHGESKSDSKKKCWSKLQLNSDIPHSRSKFLEVEESKCGNPLNFGLGPLWEEFKKANKDPVEKCMQLDNKLTQNRPQSINTEVLNYPGVDLNSEWIDKCSINSDFYQADLKQLNNLALVTSGSTHQPKIQPDNSSHKGIGITVLKNSTENIKDNLTASPSGISKNCKFIKRKSINVNKQNALAANRDVLSNCQTFKIKNANYRAKSDKELPIICNSASMEPINAFPSMPILKLSFDDNPMQLLEGNESNQSNAKESKEIGFSLTSDLQGSFFQPLKSLPAEGNVQSFTLQPQESEANTVYKSVPAKSSSTEISVAHDTVHSPIVEPPEVYVEPNETICPLLSHRIIKSDLSNLKKEFNEIPCIPVHDELSSNSVQDFHLSSSAESKEANIDKSKFPNLILETDKYLHAVNDLSPNEISVLNGKPSKELHECAMSTANEFTKDYAKCCSVSSDYAFPQIMGIASVKLGVPFTDISRITQFDQRIGGANSLIAETSVQETEDAIRTLQKISLPKESHSVKEREGRISHDFSCSVNVKALSINEVELEHSFLSSKETSVHPYRNALKTATTIERAVDSSEIVSSHDAGKVQPQGAFPTNRNTSQVEINLDKTIETVATNARNITIDKLNTAVLVDFPLSEKTAKNFPLRQSCPNDNEDVTIPVIGLNHRSVFNKCGKGVAVNVESLDIPPFHDMGKVQPQGECLTYRNKSHKEINLHKTIETVVTNARNMIGEKLNTAVLVDFLVPEKTNLLNETAIENNFKDSYWETLPQQKHKNYVITEHSEKLQDKHMESLRKNISEECASSPAKHLIVSKEISTKECQEKNSDKEGSNLDVAEPSVPLMPHATKSLVDLPHLLAELNNNDSELSKKLGPLYAENLLGTLNSTCRDSENTPPITNYPQKTTCNSTVESAANVCKRKSVKEWTQNKRTNNPKISKISESVVDSLSTSEFPSAVISELKQNVVFSPSTSELPSAVISELKQDVVLYHSNKIKETCNWLIFDEINSTISCSCCLYGIGNFSSDIDAKRVKHFYVGNIHLKTLYDICNNHSSLNYHRLFEILKKNPQMLKDLRGLLMNFLLKIPSRSELFQEMRAILKEHGSSIFDETLINLIELIKNINETQMLYAIHQLNLPISLVLDFCKGIALMRFVLRTGEPIEYILVIDEQSKSQRSSENFTNVINVSKRQIVYLKVLDPCGSCAYCLMDPKTNKLNGQDLALRYPSSSEFLKLIQEDKQLRNLFKFGKGISDLYIQFPQKFRDVEGVHILRNFHVQIWPVLQFVVKEHVKLKEVCLNIFKRCGIVIANGLANYPLNLNGNLIKSLNRIQSFCTSVEDLQKRSDYESLSPKELSQSFQNLAKGLSVLTDCEGYIKWNMLNYVIENSRPAYCRGRENISDFEFLSYPTTLMRLPTTPKSLENFKKIYNLVYKFMMVEPEKVIQDLQLFGQYLSENFPHYFFPINDILKTFLEHEVRQSFPLSHTFYNVVGTMPFLPSYVERSLYYAWSTYAKFLQKFGLDVAFNLMIVHFQQEALPLVDANLTSYCTKSGAENTKISKYSNVSDKILFELTNVDTSECDIRFGGLGL